MSTDLRYLAFSVLLAFAQILIAAMAATQVRGLAWNAGPRDAQLPPLDGVPARLERASRNMLETFPLFAAAVLLTRATGVESPLPAFGAALYFWARLVYVPLYVFGVPYVRSLAWVAAMAGLLVVLAALL